MKENRLVVADIGWAETIPEWLMEDVKAERLIYGLSSMMKPDGQKVGDAEIVLYLFTEGLRQPLGTDRTNVYLYLTAKLFEKRDKELPDFLREALDRGLNHDEEWELDELRSMIYSKRGGEIKHPLLDAMRVLKKDVERGQQRDRELEVQGQRKLDAFQEV